MMKRWIVSLPHPTWAVCLVLLFLFAPVSAHGQIERWGVKAGVTSMTASGEGIDEGVGANTGFLVGGTATMGLFGRMSLRTDLLFLRKGWTTTSRFAQIGKVTSTVNLDYLELPVLAEAEVVSVWGITAHVHAGPTIGIMIRSGEKVEGGNVRNDIDPGDTLRRTEIGLAAGIGANGEVGPQTVHVDVRYRLSLTNINDMREQTPDGLSESPPFIRNQGLSVAIGAVF